MASGLDVRAESLPPRYQMGRPLPLTVGAFDRPTNPLPIVSSTAACGRTLSMASHLPYNGVPPDSIHLAGPVNV